MGDAKHRNRQQFISLVAPIEFEKSPPLPLDPYLLGLLLGDGGLTKTPTTYTTADEELLKAVRSLLPEGVAVNFKSKYDWSLAGTKPYGWKNSNPLTAILRDLGVWGKRSEAKFLPDLYKFGSLASRRALLQGLFDTDGSITTRSKHVEFSTSSPRLCDDVRWLVESLGGTARHSTRETSRLLHHRISVALNETILPFRLTRKASLYLGRPKYPPSRAIVKVESLGEMPCHSLDIDAPDGMYITDHALLVHDSQIHSLLDSYGQSFIKYYLPRTEKTPPADST
jgi:ATP-dependent DNA helicase RecG